MARATNAQTAADLLQSVKAEMVDAFDSTGDVDLRSFVVAYPDYAEELADFVLWLRSTPPASIANNQTFRDDGAVAASALDAACETLTRELSLPPKKRQRMTASWTHPSVLALAGDKDPIEVITERARALVVNAMDAGWRGPPFDPFALAEFQKLRIIGNERVRDARILPIGVDDFVIEFNPNRPIARVRYSLAHEIAHTLFPDCGEQIRNRAAQHELARDEWQLEALCNIAASEILMPVGTLPHFSGDDLSIERLIAVRKEYQVSAEALFIRVARLADDPCLAFCATRIEDGKNAGRYRIDYTIPSESWTGPSPRSMLLPEHTGLAQCAGIGFTAKVVETWPAEIGTVYAEALGISPYPGAKFPRVVGVLRSEDIVPRKSYLTYLAGDATQPRGTGTKIIAHVVNDATPRWGAGFPLAIKKRWQQAQDDFIAWVTEDRRRLRLGNVHEFRVASDCSIIHMVAQHGYGPSPTPRIRYSALRSCLQQVAERALREHASVHMPRIGAGQAGGQWALIEELIRSTICKAGVPVLVYDVPGRSLPQQTQFELTI